MRVAAACLSALALAAVAAPLALAAQASARLVGCVRSTDPLERGLVVEGAMHARERGERMQMRFSLYRASGGGRLTPVGGPGLGAWNNASPSVDVFRFRKRIRNLPAPAVYVVRVRFRWLDADGDVVARAARRSPACVQPDPRPNLRVVAALAPGPGPQPGTHAYPIVVRNLGRAPSGDFDVVLAVDGVARPPVTVESLAPGERRVVTLAGPRCARRATFALDPDDRVDERVEGDNSRSLDCAGA
jgi:hypothetical protein